MINKIRETISNHALIEKGSKLILCVSGGPDSIAMLYAFDAIAREMDLSLLIAHVNHCLRGGESDRDQTYVEKAGRALNIPVIVCRQDAERFSRSRKLNLEAAARQLRYDFFSRLGKERGMRVIATAHTKDDQAETVLMRIIRGAGLKGLGGIPVKNTVNDITVIRPLIDISHEEIRSYLSSKKIRPRIDSSNLQTKFFRNRIRLSLLPLLRKEYNPDIKDSLLNIAELARKDHEYLESVYKKMFRKLARVKAGKEVIFVLAEIEKQHISVKRGAIRQAISYLCDNLDNIEYRHWKEIESLIKNGKRGNCVDLPGGVRASRGADILRFQLI